MAHRQVTPGLVEFAAATIARYGIDESHGMEHLRRTSEYARAILGDYTDRKIIPGVEKDIEEQLIIDASFVHDLVDAKYTPASAVADLRAELGKYYTGELADIMIEIVTSISYSKRVKRMRAGLPPIAPGRAELATMIVADADQLDGYDPERCRLYHMTRLQHVSDASREELCRGWIRTILEKRVLGYLDGYIYTDVAKRLARPKHDAVVAYIRANLSDAPLFDYSP